MASLVRSVEDLIVENGEVEGKAEADRVGGSKVGLGNLRSSLVGLERLIGRGLALIANGELGEVAVVVTLPNWALAIIMQHISWHQRTSCGRKPWTRRSGQTG